MVVVVIPFKVTETSLTMVLAFDEPPPDPPAAAVDWEEPDCDEDEAAVAWDDDAAAVVEDPMAEIDMESSPEGDIDEGSAISRSACPFNVARPRSRRSL